MPRPQTTTTTETAPSSQTKSRFQVLTPEIAKARSAKPSTSELPASSPSSSNPPHPHPSSNGSNGSNGSNSGSSSSYSKQSFFSRFRNTYTSLPYSLRLSFRVLRFLAPTIPIGIFFSEHVFQVMWVRGPSMTPYLNEDYDQMHTKMDMVLVNMWPWAGAGWPWERKRRLERGMIVTFRYFCPASYIFLKLGYVC